jgi:type II secretory ATPase GspE/PulE/Tfp pilus assembly ATPase PilB-like protein
LTIEKPVEIYIAETISQWFATGASGDEAAEFKNLLRRAVRSDAQFLMVQELQEEDEAKMFFKVANTGALGMTTVHTPSASRIVLRLKEWNIDRVILTDPEIMRLLGAVKLVKKLCPDCRLTLENAYKMHRDRKRQFPLLQESVTRIQRHANEAYSMRGLKAPSLSECFVRDYEGCPTCRDQTRAVKKAGAGREPAGTVGRFQVSEFIPPTNTLLEHLYEGRTKSAREHLRGDMKVPSIQEDGIERIVQGDACPLDVESVMGEFEDPRTFYAADILEQTA